MISLDGSLGISGVSRSPIEAVAGGGSRGKVGPVFATEVWNESESGRIGKIAGALTRGIAGARIAEISDAQILRRFGGVYSPVGTAPTLQAGIVIRDALTKQHALDPLSRQHRGNINPEFAIAPSAIAESRAEVHRAEFIQPVRTDSAKAHSARSGAVTINSSPTVVINALEGRGDIEREVIDALRKHRETLFDELKQEAARRERPDY